MRMCWLITRSRQHYVESSLPSTRGTSFPCSRPCCRGSGYGSVPLACALTSLPRSCQLAHHTFPPGTCIADGDSLQAVDHPISEGEQGPTIPVRPSRWIPAPPGRG